MAKLNKGEANHPSNKELKLVLKPEYMAFLGGSEGEVPEFIKQMNGEVDNPHPLADPLSELFGDAVAPDLLDYFGNVSHKKSLHKRALKFDELVEKIQSSLVFGENIVSIDNSSWKKLEGSAFTTEEIVNTAFLTKEHYALVSVPTGFDQYSKLVNLSDIITFLGWENYLPEGVVENWWVSALVAIWVVYEGIGLGGLNEGALQWNQWVREYSRRGKLALGENPEHPYYEKYNSCVSAEEFLWKLWSNVDKDWGEMGLLTKEGAKVELLNNKVVFDTIIWMAHIRTYGDRLKSGAPLSNYLKEYQFGNLGSDDMILLAAISVIMRDSAKGRMNLDSGDEELYAGALQYILLQEDLLAALEDATSVRKVANTSLGVIMLRDMIYYQKEFTGARKRMINQGGR